MESLSKFEEWRPCLGFEGYYEVSNLGRVRSVDHYTTPKTDTIGRKHPKRLMKGKIISQRDHAFGYKVVTLSKDNQVFTRTVHKLVAEAFLGVRENEEIVVRHLNSDPTDNRLENLQYGTQLENMQDAISADTMEFGERRYNAKFDNKTIKKIKEDLILGASPTDIFNKYGMKQSQVGKMLAGRAWRRVGPLVTRPPKNIFLTKEQKKEVLRLRELGKTYKEIAEVFGCSKNQIFTTVKKYESHKNH